MISYLLTSIDEGLLLTQLLDHDSKYYTTRPIAAGDVLPPEPVQTRTRVVILVHPKDFPVATRKG